MDETEAIAQLKRGNIAGLETLVRLYQVKALQMAYLTTRNYAMAEDVVQSAFIHAYENFAQFDTRRPFGPWFLRSVVNRALRAVSRENPQMSLENGSSTGEFDLTVESGLFETLEAAETREMVLAALDRLTPAQRAVIVLRYYLDLSDAEIVDFLKIPPGTVRRRLHDARLKLKSLLPAKDLAGPENGRGSRPIVRYKE